MSWIALCDGPKGLGDPSCKRQLLTGTSAKIPPASGWTVESNPTGEGCFLLCPGCSGVCLQRRLSAPVTAPRPSTSEAMRAAPVEEPADG